MNGTDTDDHRSQSPEARITLRNQPQQLCHKTKHSEPDETKQQTNWPAVTILTDPYQKRTNRKRIVCAMMMLLVRSLSL